MPEHTPTAAAADRNLLFGILALQMDFISREALIQGTHAWVLNKHPGVLARLFDIPATWRKYAGNVVAQSKGLPGGHHMTDSAAKEVAAELFEFLKT
jgi:hypothetical protein